MSAPPGGKTYRQAFANVEVVIKGWIETATVLGRPIPQPKGRLVFAYFAATVNPCFE